MKRTKKQFENMLDEAYKKNDWREIQEILNKEQEPNQMRVAYHEYPLSNIAVEYLSDIAHDRIMEDVSYEDFLSEEESYAYRTALGI
jgi:hypothetical protein